MNFWQSDIPISQVPPPALMANQDKEVTGEMEVKVGGEDLGFCLLA
jgi:hypothetical protein